MLDGDITERVKVAEDSLDTTSPGVYPVTFEVTNSCGDRAAVTVNAVVRDADPAGSITLTDSLIYLDRGGEFQPGDYVSAVTTSGGQTLQTEGMQIYEDGYFLTNISANGTVNTAEPGCYQVGIYIQNQQIRRLCLADRHGQGVGGSDGRIQKNPAGRHQCVFCDPGCGVAFLGDYFSGSQRLDADGGSGSADLCPGLYVFRNLLRSVPKGIPMPLPT